MNGNPSANTEGPTGRRAGGLRRGRGFTLIELLVVISIIGLLAALVLGVYPAVHRKKVLARVHTELNSVAHAIETYKAEKNFYPPDNTNNHAQPPLVYELLGVTNLNNTYFTIDGAYSISVPDIRTYFSREGFANYSSTAANEDRKAENYHKNLKQSSIGVIPSSPNVRVFTVPYQGPNGDFNTYYYNSTNPTNNTESFDLWAVIVINGQTNVIGNWKE